MAKKQNAPRKPRPQKDTVAGYLCKACARQLHEDELEEEKSHLCPFCKSAAVEKI